MDIYDDIVQQKPKNAYLFIALEVMTFFMTANLGPFFFAFPISLCYEARAFVGKQ